MDLKYKTIVCVLVFMPIFFFVYAFLHEAGHALVILAYGGQIDSFVFWSLNAHVSAIGGAFTTFGYAINHIAGMLLPTIIGAVAIGFYKPGVKFAGYHICYMASSIALLGSMSVWVIIPIVSIFTLPPPGDDVTKFLNVTRFHPLFVALAISLLIGAFATFVCARGLLSKAAFQNIKRSFTENAENADESTNNKPKHKLFFVSLALMMMAGSVFIVAKDIPYVPADAIFTAQGVVENVREEESREYTIDVKESSMFSMNIDLKAQGFVTALRIVSESGETYLQTDGEGFPGVVTTFGLDEGTYTLSIHFLADYETVSDFYKNTGFDGLNPRNIGWINETFSRDNINYSASYFITIR